ncbi:hypothetical protein Q8A67_012716 [Cirrhinus molitorella]|uniref:PSI domain-containing protein n=1 Tax=Cirrhinus molitorella TaxID=172907 RepID=A0AA88TPB8_9TELE|nr:hypothetical protein Q8A67_012716 [Cirrhinus molitorella]
MRHDLYEEKRKDITNATHQNRVNCLAPFDANGTLITCGTFKEYCEVLDINDITNSIYYESDILVGPRLNEKSVAFIAGRYLLFGKKDNDAKVQDARFSVVTLLNTLQSQPGDIFSRIAEGSDAIIQSTLRDVEFVDGFQRILPSESYLFLNAKTDKERKALVLWMNSSKEKKIDIIRSLQAAMLKCCSDKTRPVLVASTVISSVKGVIWAGAFSAQNQQEPENSALALYDISNVQGRVKWFCPIGDRPCGSESGSELQPLSVVFKYSSVSAVAAMRSESWIVLFIGTSDGQLIKLVLDETFTPGCPTVLYKSDDERAVFPKMHFDPVDLNHIYIALKNQLRRVSVVSCAKYSSLKDCRAALDPLCGWCVNTHRCSTQKECSNASWVSIPKNSLQTQLFSFHMADNSSSKITLHIALSLESTGNTTFSCAFTKESVNLCDGPETPAVFPNCSCSFSDQLLYTKGLRVSATVTIEDQKITETLSLKNCSSITDNSPNASYTQCVQCISSGCHWSSSSKRCKWTDGSRQQLNIQDACEYLLSKMVGTIYFIKPEILSLETNKVSFHGRNNVLLRGRNLESVTKIRIQGNLDCISKESPVFDRSSDTVRFHIPPSETKGTVKVCVVTPDNRCHGNSIITYSSQPSCTGIQPTVTWSSGGRVIHVQGSNMELVESVTVLPSNKVLKTQYSTSSGDVWFHSHPYDGSGQFRVLLNVQNSAVDCGYYVSYKPDPEFTEFITIQVANNLQVYIQKKADMLNLSMNEVTVAGVQGDRQYQCVLEKIESNAIICKIKGKPGVIPVVDSLTITVGNYVLGMSSTKYLFCLRSQNITGHMRHDLNEEKRKDITNATQHNRVNFLVPFDVNGTLITCGTYEEGYCEVLDINDITNSIYYERDILLGPRKDEKYVAFIADRYLLVGKKDDDAKAEDTRIPVVTLWNTLQSQPGGIFSRIADGSDAIIESTVRDVEFIDGFQRVSPSESYLFLNANTDKERKVLVLWLNSSKGKKIDIIKSLKAAVIQCCSDKVRPVLIASTVIPSVKGVIWAGVFSAQNQQDPENSALALYDISNVQGRVKGFCPIGDRLCGSESNRPTELQPLSVVFKYSSMSAVAAVRNGPWIVLFIGTSDGLLIKLVLDEKFTPGCPTVLYKSDDERAVFPKMHFDPVDFKHIYIAMRQQLRRVSVVSCANYRSLKDCRAALDPLCGWCLNSHRCSTQDECSDTSWVSIPTNSLQTQLFSFQMTENSFRKTTLYLSLSLESTGNPPFSCAFTKDSVNLCDGSETPEVFPNCSCSFSDQLLYTGGLRVSATVTIEDQKITEMLTLRNCSSITDNSLHASYTQCVQCISAGCHWSSSSQRCDWTDGSGPQLHKQDACKDLHSETKPEILSLNPNKASFHGRNNVLLTGRNLETITKIRLRADVDCIPKEFPVFDRSSDTLRFHIPPSETKGTVKVCVVTPDDRCHGNGIITYSSQPSCTGIQPTVTWNSGGRKIHLQGSNLELVESVTVLPSNKVLKTQYSTGSRDVWFHSHPYDGRGPFRLLLNFGSSTVDCGYLFYESDPKFIEFTTLQVANDLHVNILKKTDMLNLSMNEVTVTGLWGDRQYQCVLEKIESNAIICKIKGEPGTIPLVDSLTITVGNYALGLSSTKNLFCLSPENTPGHLMLDEKFTPDCPIVLYKSDDERAVFPRMHFDPVDFKHIYIALKKQLRRVSVVQCAKYSTLIDCTAALDPLCGWCVNSKRCSTQEDCLKSSWVSTTKDSLQKPLVSFKISSEKASSNITLYLSLSMESTGNPTFSCTFTTDSGKICDGSDPPVFPKCYCSFSKQLLHTRGLNVSAEVAVGDQKITETLVLKDCLNIKDNSPSASYTQCVQCISSGCHWSSSSKRCEWAHGQEIHTQDACNDVLYETKYEEPEIFSLEPNKASFHGRNNVLLRGKNLETITKIRIQENLNCFSKEFPVVVHSSDTLRFHIPPSETKGTVKVCVVTPDDRCHGNSIITYSSQPSCTGIQPTVTWNSGGRKIHVKGSNLEFVESAIFPSSYKNYDLKTQYSKSSKVCVIITPA